ncbi:MAG: hypothetical protein MJE68_22070 [Proteobacteria bacterium]|nr:hypothetical protein [Pseudomonadota bacterium]
MWRPWSDSPSPGESFDIDKDTEIDPVKGPDHVPDTQSEEDTNLAQHISGTKCVPETSSSTDTPDNTTNNYLRYINVLAEQNIQAGKKHIYY